jgi:hypothetical protein
MVAGQRSRWTPVAGQLKEHRQSGCNRKEAFWAGALGYRVREIGVGQVADLARKIHR